MNLYLATRHLLSLLESPLTPERFEAQMQANPLFTSGCMRPQRFLFFLADEGILAAQGLHVQLTTTGRLLARQVLNWSLAPEPIQQERREAWAHRSGEKPESVRPECPVCGQRFCALYVFVVLLERLSAGLAEPWETLEQQLVTRALAQASTPTLERLCLQSETFPFNQWPVSVREKLAPLLASMDWDPLPIAAESRALVPTLPDLKWPCERISRLRLDYGLMSGPARLYLQALMSPELYPRSALALQQARGIPQTAFIRLLRPLFQQDQALVLWLENAMPAGVVFIKKPAWEIQQVFRG